MSAPYPRVTLRWAIPLAVALVALLPGRAAAAGDWTCEASAVRGTVLSALPLDPLQANRGQAACRPATAGIATPPGLPLPISLNALTARTTLDGPAPAGGQVAGAAAGVADLRVSALPGLPLPQPDFGPNALLPLNVPLIGTITVDLRPALEALLQPLPDLDLLRVQAVQATATARCVAGAPQLTGASSIAGLTIGGRQFAVDRPITETVELIDTQSIDPSDIDLTKVVLPLGVNLGAVQLLLQPALDALPVISVPPTLAHVRAVPNQQIRAAGRLTQRALAVEVSVAGRSVADLAVAEATVGSAGVSCPSIPNRPPDPIDPTDPGGPTRPSSPGPRSPAAGTAQEALRCTERRLVLIDVAARRGRVRLLGAADRRFAGRRVAIKLMATGQTVARPRVSASGLFRASAPLPRRAIRSTNRARYRAAIGRERSLPLKLVRRMLVTRTSVSGGRVTLAGRLLRPLAPGRQSIVLRRRVSCGSWETVKRFRPAANGRFRVTVGSPGASQVAVFRLQTRVAGSWSRTRLTPTFSLPQFVAA